MAKHPDKTGEVTVGELMEALARWPAGMRVMVWAGDRPLSLSRENGTPVWMVPASLPKKYSGYGFPAGDTLVLDADGNPKDELDGVVIETLTAHQRTALLRKLKR